MKKYYNFTISKNNARINFVVPQSYADKLRYNSLYTISAAVYDEETGKRKQLNKKTHWNFATVFGTILNDKSYTDDRAGEQLLRFYNCKLSDLLI